jgi:hypothetical protein
LKPITRTGFLPLERVHDDRFKVGALDIGFAVGAAGAAEVVQDDVDILIVVPGNDRWCPARITHRNSPRNKNENSSVFDANRSGRRNAEIGTTLPMKGELQWQLHIP